MNRTSDVRKVATAGLQIGISSAGHDCRQSKIVQETGSFCSGPAGVDYIEHNGHSPAKKNGPG
jgi:hypothetical protein